MSESLTYDEIEMWLVHPNLYMNNLEEIKNTPDGSDIGCFVEVDLSYPDNNKHTSFYFVLKIKLFLKKIYKH